MTIKALLFDKDGTLFDFYASWGRATEEAALLVAQGNQLDAEHLLRESGMEPSARRFLPGSPLAAGSNRQIAELWARLLGRADVDHVYATIERRFFDSQMHEAAPVIADMPAYVTTLRQRGLRLGLATMDSERSAHASLARLGVSFDFVCGFDSGHGVKPGAGMVKAFCAAAAVHPNAIAVLGDSPHDIHMAHAAGAGLAIGVLTGVSTKDELHAAGAHVILENIGMVLSVLDRPIARRAY
ncbi:MAG TPA: HAD family hydrolase [Dongiaceae bacterium]|jgi:phosphoglycolate phosphatase|nr:HAD family hydrolase [Dongiaceae bacterium]